MKLINITINADSHDEYKQALKILGAGIGAGDMSVKKTSTKLEAGEDVEDDEEEAEPAKKTIKKKPAGEPTTKKPAPKKPTKPEPEEDEEDNVEDDEDEETEPQKKTKKAAEDDDLEAVRALAYEKNKTHKEEVKKLVKSYGVATFSELSGAKLSDFAKKLAKIGAKKKAAPAEDDDEDFMS